MFVISITKKYILMAYAKIKKSRSVKNPFKVSFHGNNGEPIGNPETLSTRANVKKNLLAHMKLFNGYKVIVHDETAKPTKKYWLNLDGTVSDL